MDINTIISIIQNHGKISFTIILLIVLNLFEISPIKINPITFIKNILFRPIKRSIKEIYMEESAPFVEQIKNTLDEHMHKIDERYTQLENNMNSKIDNIEEKNLERFALSDRAKILQFGDELLDGSKKSKDSFKHIFLTIKMYDEYCKNHPDFENHITLNHSNLIRKIYNERLNNNDFL